MIMNDEMTHLAVFSRAVTNSPDLPQPVIDRVHQSRNIEEHSFDETYIEFLDEQITLNARGDEWSDRLRIRMERLRPFVNKKLVRGDIPLSNPSSTAQHS